MRLLFLSLFLGLVLVAAEEEASQLQTIEEAQHEPVEEERQDFRRMLVNLFLTEEEEQLQAEVDQREGRKNKVSKSDRDDKDDTLSEERVNSFVEALFSQINARLKSNVEPVKLSLDKNHKAGGDKRSDKDDDRKINKKKKNRSARDVESAGHEVELDLPDADVQEQLSTLSEDASENNVVPPESVDDGDGTDREGRSAKKPKSKKPKKKKSKKGKGSKKKGKKGKKSKKSRTKRHPKDLSLPVQDEPASDVPVEEEEFADEEQAVLSRSRRDVGEEELEVAPEEDSSVVALDDESSLHRVARAAKGGKSKGKKKKSKKGKGKKGKSSKKGKKNSKGKKKESRKDGDPKEKRHSRDFNLDDVSQVAEENVDEEVPEEHHVKTRSVDEEEEAEDVEHDREDRSIDDGDEVSDAALEEDPVEEEDTPLEPKERANMKMKTKKKSSSAFLTGLSTMRRSGDVKVKSKGRQGDQILSAPFTIGPVKVEVTDTYTNEAGEETEKSANVVAPEIEGEVTLVITKSGEAKVTKIQFKKPAVITTEGSLSDSSKRSDEKSLQKKLFRANPIAKKTILTLAREVLKSS